MSCAKDARKLADYITGLSLPIQVQESANNFSYYHVGALLTDVVLQAGLNYHSVVKPRVQHILLKYPDDYTVYRFNQVIGREGLGAVINWRHETKLDRFQRLLDFAVSNQIDTCHDFKAFFCKRESYDTFLSLKGFGPKSLDYILKLLNVDTVAVDRHIYSFVKMANIQIRNYEETKRIVEYAADFLNMRRSAMDQIIWNYMSQRQYLVSAVRAQCLIPFPENSKSDLP